MSFDKPRLFRLGAPEQQVQYQEIASEPGDVFPASDRVFETTATT